MEQPSAPAPTPAPAVLRLLEVPLIPYGRVFAHPWRASYHTSPGLDPDNLDFDNLPVELGGAPKYAVGAVAVAMMMLTAVGGVSMLAFKLRKVSAENRKLRTSGSFNMTSLTLSGLERGAHGAGADDDAAAERPRRLMTSYSPSSSKAASLSSSRDNSRSNTPRAGAAAATAAAGASQDRAGAVVGRRDSLTRSPGGSGRLSHRSLSRQSSAEKERPSWRG